MRLTVATGVPLIIGAAILAIPSVAQDHVEGEPRPRSDLSGVWTLPVTTFPTTATPGSVLISAEAARDRYSLRVVALADGALHTDDWSGEFDGKTLKIKNGSEEKGGAVEASYVFSTEGAFEALAPSAGAPARAPRAFHRLTEPDVRCPAEWEPVEEILWAYQDRGLGVRAIYHAAIAATEANGEKVKHHFFVSPSDRETLTDDLGELEIPAERLAYTEFNVDGVWMRDCGPMVAFRKRDAARIVIDLGDNGLGVGTGSGGDLLPRHYSRTRGWEWRDLNDLILAGGNFMTDGKGRVFLASSVLENVDNGSQEKVEELLHRAGAREVVYFERMPHPKHADPDRQIVDPGHIDMFAKLVDAKTVIVSECDDDAQNKQVLDRNARRFEALGYRVVRILEANSAKLETYANSLLIGKTALVPVYDSKARDAAALDAYRKLGWKAKGIDARAIVQHNGAIHCLAMQVARAGP